MADALYTKIKNDMFKFKRSKKHEKVWPYLQTLAKMAGYGITKKGQSGDKTFRYDLKK